MVQKIQKQHIVIIGGGFGGVKTALELAQHADKFQITLISDRPDFWYYPTLYHTATGGTRAQSSIPLKFLLRNQPIEIVINHVEHLDRENKQLVLHSKRLVPYDKLVLALGVVTNYFGIQGLEEFSYGIKSLA